MPFFLVLIGIAMIVTGARDTYAQAGSMVTADLTGSNGGAGFIWYMAAIGGVGALGAVPELKTLSHYLLALILIAIVLNNRGVFSQFTAALKSLPAASAGSGLAASPGGAAPYVTPQQGVQQGRAGVGIDWTAPFKSMMKFFGGGG
jgi:hypothetical protein